jgi:hypothetical protein
VHPTQGRMGSHLVVPVTKGKEEFEVTRCGTKITGYYDPAKVVEVEAVSCIWCAMRVEAKGMKVAVVEKLEKAS